MNERRNRRFKQMEIALLGICICIIFCLCLYRYIKIYHYEYKEHIQIMQMQGNIFPSIMPTIWILPENMNTLTMQKEQNIASQHNAKSDQPTKITSSWTGDCILSIPDINLEKIVYTGADRLKHLEEYGLATAADTMQYKKGGNYIICGHASRLYGHSLNRIKEVEKGDRIYIKTQDTKDSYIVHNVHFESMNKTSKYCSQTSQRQITIISCAKYVSKESYIVITAIPE